MVFKNVSDYKFYSTYKKRENERNELAMKISFQKILLLALTLISSSVWAQGALRGVVTDTLDNSRLVGANVY